MLAWASPVFCTDMDLGWTWSWVMDREACRAVVFGVAKNDMTEWTGTD